MYNIQCIHTITQTLVGIQACKHKGIYVITHTKDKSKSKIKFVKMSSVVLLV